MQTALVGERGFLSYEFVFEQQPGNSWVATYFAEIEDLAPPETRNFTVKVMDWQEYSGLTVDVAAEAGGKYRLYELRYINESIQHLLFMKLRKMNNFSKGPIINAMEMYKYLPITADHSNHAKHRLTIIIAVCAAFGFFLLLSIVAIGCYCYFRRKKKLPEVPEEELSLIQAAVGRYSVSDMEEATNGFDRQIGSGGSAVIFYGKLPDGREIVAKRLKNPEESHGDFMNEINLLSRIHHRNLLSFLGYVQHSENNILVYEFMHNGTLNQHLHGGESDPRIKSWAHRLQIAADVARGMEYMHRGCTPGIVHRDMKTNNILLDSNMRGKIADFGLSRPMVDGAQLSERGRGTYGYMDPYMGGQLSEKIDIYSFGVILLELITGREAVHAGPDGGPRSIVEWARPEIESGNVEAVIDVSLDAGCKPESLQIIGDLAIRCLRPKYTDRPSSSEIVKDIEEAVQLQSEPPKQMPVGDEDSDDDCQGLGSDASEIFHDLIKK